jgi:YidC/Oxa1 family membrane protein insertase
MESDSKRAIIAVVLSAIVLFSWQYFFPAAPVVNTNNTQSTTAKNAGTEAKASTIVSTENNNTADTVSVAANVEEIRIFNGDKYYIIDSGLNLVEMNAVNSLKVFPELFENTKIKFNIVKDSKIINSQFKFSQMSEAKFKGIDENNKLTVVLEINDKGFLNVNLNSDTSFGYVFKTTSKEIQLENSQFNQYFIFSEELKTYSVGEEEKIDMNVKWFGTDFKYHLAAVVFENPIINKINMNEEGSFVLNSIKSSSNLNFKYLFLNKKYDDLLHFGYNLDASIDFGIWALIAVPILKGLQFFFTIFPNYGISIILLTIVIRTLTFPLQYKSFKSMKKMQVIQPELTKLREKYKDEPQVMQKETMALFKKAGANPLGGCLPLLLQMPIFFAFYKVLYSAVELVDAPFYFWIMDLSEKDPYYVLPVLMSIAMFLNTKLTPTTTADPAQQKIMMFMPLIFGFIMKDLPAGLTLYIFVSTVMGMCQQLFVYKRVS